MVAHTRRRADKQYIADQLLSSGVEVILEKVNGNKVIYDNVKSAKGFCKQIIKRCTETGEIKSIKSIVDSEGISYYSK